MASQTPDFPPEFLAGIRQNESGYYEVADKPDGAALHAYYTPKYFQQSQGQYQKTYSEAEQRYLHNRPAALLLVYVTLTSVCHNFGTAFSLSERDLTACNCHSLSPQMATACCG